MIEVKNVTKYYGNIKAVDSLSFEIKKGEVVGFLGPNGAGKSTTLKMMSGLLVPNSGTISIFGVDVFEQSLEAKQKIGYLPEKNPLYTEYTVEQYLTFMGNLKNIRNLKQNIFDVANRTFINTVFHKPIYALSKGYRQRVGLAAALLGDPELLLLDEPTVGLDPNQIVDIRNLIREMGNKSTVFLSTHILQEVSVVCDKVIIINDGKLLAIDKPDNLSYRLSGQNKLTVIVKDFDDNALLKLREIDGVDEIKIDNQFDKTILTFFSQPDKEIQNAVASILLFYNIRLSEMKLDKLSLESVFQQLTKGASDE